MKKINLILITILTITIAISGCVNQIPEEDVTLTVNNAEKRNYNDYGEPASSGNIFLYVFFTIKNNANKELSTNSLFFKLWTLNGTYSPEWIFGSGGSQVTSISEGASASYYIAFEIPETSNVSTEWKLKYSGWQTTKSANLANIKSGFHDMYLATLTIDSYHYSDIGDYSWKTPEEGNTFIYVNITLSNSEDNDESISTNPYYFMLYTAEEGYNYEGDKEGIPDEITPGNQASWYIYFEIPEDATLDKLQYDTYGIAPADANFI
jgi:hypothetical protein